MQSFNQFMRKVHSKVLQKASTRLTSYFPCSIELKRIFYKYLGVGEEYEQRIFRINGERLGVQEQCQIVLCMMIMKEAKHRYGIESIQEMRGKNSNSWQKIQFNCEYTIHQEQLINLLREKNLEKNERSYDFVEIEEDQTSLVLSKQH